MKTVLLPVKVPSEKYCFEQFEGTSRLTWETCEHFDSSERVECALFNVSLKSDGYGYVKCDKCKALKEEVKT